MKIGELIKKRRIDLGMSQDELAQKVGYKSRSSINKIEVDGRGLPQSKILAFAKALGTTPAYLMGWTDDLCEYVVEEDKETVKHFLKYNHDPDDMNDEEMSIKKLLNTFGYDLSHTNNKYYIIDDYGAYLITKEELNDLISDVKKYLQFNIDKISKEKRNSLINKFK